MKPIPHIFPTPSPRLGELINWEAIAELGTENLISFVSRDSEEDGYNDLLKVYTQYYGDS